MEETKYDLLSVGDVALDTYLVPQESDTLCMVDSKESLICFSYGDKIPVKSLSISVGGNAGNNAVGVSRLGLKVGLVSTLGGDSIGNQILEKLNKEGVDLTYTIRQENALTNSSTILSYQGERTIFTYHAPRSYEFPVTLPQVGWVYLTSMGESFRPFYNHFLDYLKTKPDTKLAFNPGSRQLRALSDITEAIKLTHMIYVNKQEAQKITGYEENDIKELLIRLNSLGPKIVVITAGSDGSYVYDGNIFLKSGVLPVDAYERTGAGDAFGSGCISAIIKGKTLEEALLWGTVNSASVIGYIGPQQGLLREEDIPLWMERAKSSGVRVEEF
ncbi:carbohydrate kinase family protein [Candidatus Woesebacteria bacterium]|nr:MAG: carbohydrate kinase family protein [Candidatus Woesebacteria bacterium]